MFSRPPQIPVDSDSDAPQRGNKRRQRPQPERRPPTPLDPARLEQLALAYTARFATSAAKLEDYLARKLRTAGWADEDAPEAGQEVIAALVARFVGVGYVDDAGFAEAKAGSMLRRGLGARRISGALSQAGIAEDIRADVAPDAGAARRSALIFARKRRFGPFGAEPPDRARGEKQLAAMLRAGHSMTQSRALIRAASVEEAEEWAAEDCED